MISAISMPAVQAGAWAVATSPVTWVGLGALVLFIGAYYCISQAREVRGARAAGIQALQEVADQLASQQAERSKVEGALIRLLIEDPNSEGDFTTFTKFRTADKPHELFGLYDWKPFEGAAETIQDTTTPLADIAANALAIVNKVYDSNQGCIVKDLYPEAMGRGLAGLLANICPADERLAFYRACLDRQPIKEWKQLPIFFKMDEATRKALIKSADFSEFESLWDGGSWPVLEEIAREMIQRLEKNPGLKVPVSFQKKIVEEITLDKGMFSAVTNGYADDLRDIILPKLFLFVDDWACQLDKCLIDFDWGLTGYMARGIEPMKEHYETTLIYPQGVEHYFSNIKAMDAAGLDWQAGFGEAFFKEKCYGKVRMLTEHAPKHLERALLKAFMERLPKVSEQDVYID